LCARQEEVLAERHRFCLYADDVNVYDGSRRAGQKSV